MFDIAILGWRHFQGGVFEFALSLSYCRAVFAWSAGGALGGVQDRTFPVENIYYMYVLSAYLNSFLGTRT